MMLESSSIRTVKEKRVDDLSDRLSFGLGHGGSFSQGIGDLSITRPPLAFSDSAGPLARYHATRSARIWRD